MARVFAKQCAALACGRRGFPSPEARRKCEEKYFARFKEWADAQWDRCATSCGADLRFPDYKCEPNLCKDLCCSEEEGLLDGCVLPEIRHNQVRCIKTQCVLKGPLKNEVENCVWDLIKRECFCPLKERN
jgi:hypothetical protein